MNALGGDAGVIYIPATKSKLGTHILHASDGHLVVRNRMYRRKVDARLAGMGVPATDIAPLDDHFVVNEYQPDMAQRLLDLGCTNVYIWWLSVDNFPLSKLHQLSNIALIHKCHNLCQSAYAYEFVKNLDAPKVSMLSDFVEIGSTDTPDVPIAARRHDIAYLPNKSKGAEPVLSHLRKSFDVIALQGMSRAQMENTLRNTKVFIDFGNHPGKDRVPREAALCGAIPLVRRAGAAAFFADVPLPDELLVQTSEFFDPARFGERVRSVIAAADRWQPHLEAYKTAIRSERGIFDDELRAMIALPARQSP